MEYRTREQFEEIIESTTNGNWTQAAEECIKYGFYANDLISKYKEIQEEYGEKPYTYFEESDLAILAEMIAELRYKKEE